MSLLQEALVDWGVGAKTSLGDGRIVGAGGVAAFAAGGSHAGEAKRWVDQAVAEFGNQFRVSPRTVLRGRHLAERRTEMEEGPLRQAVREEILVRLVPAGLLTPVARPSKNKHSVNTIHRNTADQHLPR